MNKNVQYMYKMRSPNKLLENPYYELERQEIYFSSLEKLNDPYEGVLDVCWKGDEVLWKNLLRQYLISLYRISNLFFFSKGEYDFSSKDIDVYENVEKLPSEYDKKIFRDCEKDFFNDARIKSFVEFLIDSHYSFHEKDIKSLLSFINPIAVEYIFKKYDYEKTDFFAYLSTMIKDLKLQTFFDQLKKKIKQSTVSLILQYVSTINEQLYLITLHNNTNKDFTSRMAFFLTQFPIEFINKLITLVVPKAFVSSFMLKIDNPTLWAYYAENHTGACLVFKCKNSKGNLALKLNAETTGSSDSYLLTNLNKIKYSRKTISINFFKYINALPLESLHKNWYEYRSKKTIYIDKFGIEKSLLKWKKELWDIIYLRSLRKLPEWKNENEYRLVINDNQRWDAKKDGIKAAYKFEDLDGIVFGYKMKIDDKLKVIEIIKKKCKENNRHHFNFYQANYSLKKNKMEIQKLDLLNNIN